MTLWHGRYSTEMDTTLWDLSESYSFDQILWRFDLVGSHAHVRGLKHAGLVSDDEENVLRDALDQVATEFNDGTFQARSTDEDLHTAIERRVTELAGAVGEKLHTARSRNDQVATTLRLYVRAALFRTATAVLDLMQTLDQLADRYANAVLPGYTHMQRAQPVLLSHHLRAHAWALARDVDRLLDCVVRLNVSPLGAGALAGTSLAVDPSFTAAALGFDRPFANSLDAVSDRDFVAETLFDIALLGIHCSRMGEELVLWTTAEFNFASLDEPFTTGSSMLPHKRNSDVAELARAKTGRLVGNLTSLLVTLKGLPLAYNRDLQEDKEPLFDSVRQILLVLPALAGAYGSLTFHEEVARAAASDPLTGAIDLAEWLVERGTPFRAAHARVGALVAESVRSGRSLTDLVGDDEELADAAAVLTPEAAINRRRSPGASGPDVSAAQRDQLASVVAELHVRMKRVELSTKVS